MAEQRIYRRWISVDFFEVKCGLDPENGACFGQVLNDLHARYPDIPSRTVEVWKDQHRVHDWSFNEGVGTGSFLRFRRGDAPKIASIDSDILKDLDLQEGEVLTEYFCFAYFSQFRTLVVHRNRDAGGAPRFATYATQLMEQPIHFNSFLKKDGMNKISQMRDISVAELGISVPKNKGLLEQDWSTADEMIGIINKTGAANFHLKLSMGHTNKPLHLQIRDWWSDIVRVYGPNITVARVTGNVVGDDIAVEVLDLLDVNMKEVVRFEGERSPSIADIHSLLKQTYQKRKNDIQIQFTARRV